ncbi:chemotaxis protein CheW [Roseospira navarrensis]|uniref:Chemotaxis protein CheW n=1 Tax=Roseospira navarrensis TaxID=140058 RepID=A0A7X1ZDN1_9PROT|nr:chemotaxis protein CheW [Roseospira navarrensis]MQX36417.1 chemotaxis protein CheW [Roseospira navarrensis]
MNQVATVSQDRDPATRGGRAVATVSEDQVFVTIYVHGQLFGIPVERVQDILIPEKVARIPLAPTEIAGAINLRGRIVTVIEVRKRLGLPKPKDQKKVMCVTVEQGNELYSLMVDSVGNVHSLSMDAIEPNPSTLDSRWRSVSQGVVRLDGELMVVMDVDAFLSFE